MSKLFFQVSEAATLSVIQNLQTLYSNIDLERGCLSFEIRVGPKANSSFSNWVFIAYIPSQNASVSIGI